MFLLPQIKLMSTKKGLALKSSFQWTDRVNARGLYLTLPVLFPLCFCFVFVAAVVQSFFLAMTPGLLKSGIRQSNIVSYRN